MKWSIIEHNGADFGENYLFVSASGAMGVFHLKGSLKWPKNSILLSKPSLVPS
jgi:hypothetical protein